jgi:predicted TIM-barrel enzyme
VFCGADALVVTGPETGQPTHRADVETVRAAGGPVAVGSGVNPDNAAALAAVSDALIVGSFLKVGGDWRAPVDPERVRLLRSAMVGSQS